MFIMGLRKDSMKEVQLKFKYMHNTNARFKDFPKYKCCLVEIKGDSYRKVDIVYYYQGFRIEV